MLRKFVSKFYFVRSYYGRWWWPSQIVNAVFDAFDCTRDQYEKLCKSILRGYKKYTPKSAPEGNYSITGIYLTLFRSPQFPDLMRRFRTLDNIPKGLLRDASSYGPIEAHQDFFRQFEMGSGDLSDSIESISVDEDRPDTSDEAAAREGIASGVAIHSLISGHDYEEGYLDYVKLFRLSANKHRLHFRDINFGRVELSGNSFIMFEFCKKIDSVEFIGDADGNVPSATFRDCEIGEIIFNESSVAQLDLRRCKLHKLSYVGDESKNPFCSSVNFTNTKFRSHRDSLSSEYEYRTIRQKLLETGNDAAAAELHGVEQYVRRPSEPASFRALNMGYQVLSRYGNSPTRSFICLMGTFAAFGALYWFFQVPGVIDGYNYSGWEKELAGSRFLRALVYSVGPSFDPLTLTGLADLLTTDNKLFAGLRFFQRIIAVSCIATFLLAIKRRFRIS